MRALVSPATFDVVVKASPNALDAHCVDATAESDVARDAFLRRLAAAGDEADDDLSLNEKLVLLYRAQVDALLVRNAPEAVSQVRMWLGGRG